jgi:two-component system KDP operon response regulator KdpE
MARLSGLRVLLVEDDPDIRDAFTLLLRSEGTEVRTAATGRDAADAAAGWRFDVLLTDLGLPDIPGDRLIRHVLATAPARPLVIVVTGYGQLYAARARDAGADVVLSKPIEWTDLLERLRGVSTASPGGSATDATRSAATVAA